MVRRWARPWWFLVLAVVAASCASSPSSPRRGPSTPRDFDPLAPTRLMQEGQALVGQGRVDDGIAKYRAAAGLQPENPTIHNLIGIAELQRGNSVEALEAFNAALKLAPTYSDARNNRGTTYMRLGQFAQAEADLLTVLADMTYANRTGIYFNLGTLYLARGNLAAAEENLKKAATPSGPMEAFLFLGQVEEQLGRVELAENAYRTAMRRAPERPDVPLRLALMLEAGGREAEAAELFQQVVSLAPGSPEAAQARGHLEN